MNLLKAERQMPDRQPPIENDPDFMPRRRTRVEELQQQIQQLRKTMRIAVIFGGDKQVDGAVIHQTYNPRSWKSYEPVADDIAGSLRRLGFQFVTTMPDDMRLGDRLRREAIDFAWLNTGGVQGLGSVGHAAAMLEMFGVPYVGHNPLGAATLDNKHVFKRDLVIAGIPTAPFVVWQPWQGSMEPHGDPRFQRVFGDYPGPFIVKPVSGRASVHVTLVDDLSGLRDAAETVFSATSNSVLIERFLSGREYCISICGEVIAKHERLERLHQPFTFAKVERLLSQDEQIFTSMDRRPITTDRLHSLNSAEDRIATDRLETLAQRIYAEFDIETLIRLDVREDRDGNFYVLEANPKPDLAAPTEDKTSLVCSGLEAEGMTYDDLILSLLADRVDVLFSQRRSTVEHLSGMLS